jgi:hypothetical protein
MRFTRRSVSSGRARQREIFGETRIVASATLPREASVPLSETSAARR